MNDGLTASELLAGEVTAAKAIAAIVTTVATAQLNA